MPLPNFGGGFMARGGGTTTGGALGQPHRGQGPYGMVPGEIGVPENIYSQLGRNLPNFGALSSGASGIVGSEQSGQLSPETLGALKSASAQFGISSGMPGSGLSSHNLLGNIAGFSENRQRQGLQDYMGLLNTTAPLQTNPGLAYQVADRNALYASAPDPQMAAEQQMADWYRKFLLTQQASRGYGGPGGGTMGGNRGPITYGPRSQGSATHGFQLPESSNPAPGYSTGEGYWSGGSYITPAGAGGVTRPTPYSPGGGGGYGGEFDWSNPDNYATGGGYDWSNPDNYYYGDEG